jgi:hypothetical protein
MRSSACPAATDAQATAAIPYAQTHLDRIILSYKERSPDFSVQRHDVPMHNARIAADAPSLDRHGFMLIDAPSQMVRDRLDELIAENALPRETVGPVSLSYLDEMTPLMMALSGGAREVFAQYGTITIRFSSRAAHRSWMTTAQFAHLDFEHSQVEDLLADTLHITGRKVMPYRRHVMLQTWRVITPPPQDMPLALCDGRTVSIEDIIPMDYRGVEGSRNELVRSRGCRYAPRHKWYYYPSMTPAELLVFKGYDSTAPEGMNAMHTAFDDVSVTDAVPRGSIEARFIALYD